MVCVSWAHTKARCNRARCHNEGGPSIGCQAREGSGVCGQPHHRLLHGSQSAYASARQEVEQVETRPGQTPQECRDCRGHPPDRTGPITLRIKTNRKLRTNWTVANGPQDRAGGKKGKRTIATLKPSRAASRGQTGTAAGTATSQYTRTGARPPPSQIRRERDGRRVRNGRKWGFDREKHQTRPTKPLRSTGGRR